MDFVRYDPLRVFETGGQVSRLLNARFTAGVGTNQTVIGAITGQRIRIMGWRIQGSTGTPGTFIFRSASGGTPLAGPYSVPSNAAGLKDDLPITNSGYMETNTGEGLFVDITVADIVVNIFYVTYAP